MRQLISQNRGFTLVEMLVVLALFGLLLVVITPNLAKAQASRQQAAHLRLLESKLNGLGVRAIIARQPVAINDALAPLAPAEWRLVVMPEMAYYDANGLCNATAVAVFKGESLLRRWDFAPPLCAVK